MRVVLSLFPLILGVVLGLVSYFWLAAPLGTPLHEGFSNPKVPFAATIFVVSIVLVFLSPILYELLPEKEAK
ncbi:MAG: hypothetical protein ACE5Q6_02150 [Dehalococcoidia bacterium]